MMDTSDRVILRLYNDITEARAELVVLQTLERAKIYTTGFEFFTLAYRAFFNSMMLHVIRIFTQGGRDANFWYLYRHERDLVTRHLLAAQVELKSWRSMSKKLDHARNKSHAHIDTRGVHDPSPDYS